MMPTQLTSWLLFQNAADHFGEVEIVSKEAGGTHRYTYRDFARRAQQLMHALDALGIERGERVATLAWNHYRHLECYFAVPCTERVLHTLNVRLSIEDLAYIIEHADDRAIFVDPDQVPTLERLAPALSRVAHIVVLGAEVPASTLPNLVAYEDLIRGRPTTYPPREIPETAAMGLCYTSGTTGRPKGVVYTHRSTFLHSLVTTSMATFALGPGDAVFPVVSMFHANAWGIPHAAVMVGAKIVLGGRDHTAANLVDLLQRERITISVGVPTIWFSVADELARRNQKLPDLRRIFIGGAQPPTSLIERYRTEFGIPIHQIWGMTETSPLASVAWPKEYMRDWPDDRLTEVVRTQAGLPLPGVQISIRGPDGAETPRDGKTMGDLLVRGPWIIDGYFRGEGKEQFTDDGWFRTGDVAIASPEGYFVIGDRTKDLIKSGGEWISSVDMERTIMALPEVEEAAVIAIPDDKWQERPLACIAVRSGHRLDLAQVRAHLAAHGFASWQLPDRIEIIDAVPKTSVGKFDKKALRARFATR
ncbi:MAG TPA: long-chain fatty acid--CoA ligase [Candidatus Limnocylindrales bacterium]|jgi:fatty-acyl-CoA synthase|nr:long-chain fatty acid--CoA ligase [Candidatus Limnocylindrales bacterium]